MFIKLTCWIWEQASTSSLPEKACGKKKKNRLSYRKGSINSIPFPPHQFFFFPCTSLYSSFSKRLTLWTGRAMQCHPNPLARVVGLHILNKLRKYVLEIDWPLQNCPNYANVPKNWIMWKYCLPSYLQL